MKKTLFLAAALTAALTLSATTAFAATDVTIPIGDWATGIGNFITTFAAPLFLGFIALISKDLPASIVTWLKTQQVEQLLEKAVQFGLNTATASLPANVTVPVTNDVIAAAANYAIAHAPSVVAWAGGAQAIEDKILARLNVTPLTVSPPAA